MPRSVLSLATLAVLLLGCGDKATEPPQTVNVINGQVAILASEAQVYWVDVTSDMKDPILDGTFTVTAGGSKDISALVLDEVGYVNWSNGNHATALYYQERVTTGRFSLPLEQPGRYWFVLSNGFSLLTSKVVVAAVTLTYRG